LSANRTPRHYPYPFPQASRLSATNRFEGDVRVSRSEGTIQFNSGIERASKLIHTLKPQPSLSKPSSQLPPPKLE
jgi:hypothetical protein